MAFIIADRVAETTTTTGTGTINLAGANTGFQSFVSGVGDTNSTYYTITDNTDWEVGIGTVTAGSPDTLSRDTVLQSTNSDAAVNWGAGTKDVFLGLPADRVVTTNKDNTFTGDNVFEGDVRFTDEGELTIITGEITVTAVNHTVDTEGDDASDDLNTINGGADGQLLVIRPENTSRTIVLKDGTGNIECPQGADITLDTTEKSVLLKYDGALEKWIVIASPSVELLDEDDFSSDSDTQGATQQSIKAYVDSMSVKFWVRSPGSSTITDSYNVASITDHGVGQFTITIDEDFSNADWCPLMSCQFTTGTTGANIGDFAIINQDKNTPITAGSIRVAVLNNATGSGANVYSDNEFYVAGLGD